MEQPTTQGPPRMLADQNPSFSTEGKGLSPPHEPNLKQTSEQRYVPKSFTNNLCPSTSSWTPKIFSEQLASYFGRPLGVGDYYGLQNRVSLYASPDSLASHFRVNNPTGGCSSRERQNGGFVSSIFLVDKKDGGHCLVINLKNLNSFVHFQHFKMEGIHMLRDLLKKKGISWSNWT